MLMINVKQSTYTKPITIVSIVFLEQKTYHAKYRLKGHGASFQH